MSGALALLVTVPRALANLGALTFLALSLHTGSGAHAIVATPEHPYDRVRVGDTYIVPLYDGALELTAGPVTKLGIVRIPYRSFALTDTVRVGSNRGEAFRVTGTGAGTILVALRAPALAERCVSCRTVHFFFRASP